MFCLRWKQAWFRWPCEHKNGGKAEALVSSGLNQIYFSGLVSRDGKAVLLIVWPELWLRSNVSLVRHWSLLGPRHLSRCDNELPYGLLMKVTKGPQQIHGLISLAQTHVSIWSLSEGISVLIPTNTWGTWPSSGNFSQCFESTDLTACPAEVLLTFHDILELARQGQEP